MGIGVFGCIKGPNLRNIIYEDKMSVGLKAAVAIALYLTVFQPGFAVDTDHKNASKKNSATKQYVVTHQSLPGPLQYNPPTYHRQHIYLDPWMYPPKPGVTHRSSSGSRALLLAVLFLLEKSTTTAAPSTTTVVCSYTAWEACSSVCKGTRQRTKTCGTVSQTEMEDCNTEMGFLSNGWYRAANCYDYFVGGPNSYDDSEAACDGLGGRLASAGMRDNAIRTDVLTNLYNLNNGPAFAYIGADSSSGNWVWSDGTTSEPTFWNANQPGVTVADHLRVTLGNVESGVDISGNAPYNYICERAAS